MICPECGRKVDCLHYNRCGICFDSWKDRDNPEPAAKKLIKKPPKCKSKFGIFVVKIGANYWCSKTQLVVDFCRATVYGRDDKAQSAAERHGGVVMALSVVDG